MGESPPLIKPAEKPFLPIPIELAIASSKYYSIYMDTAKLFNTGGSQAVRLPKDYRFDGTEVFIRKEGASVVLEPKVKRRWPKGFFRSIRIKDRRFKRPAQGALPPVREL